MAATEIKRITFVWNADFSIAGGIRALQEVVEGEHSCSLCEIAYHRVTQTKEWKRYKKSLAQHYGAEIRQPCKNQLSKKERQIAEQDFPTVLAHTDQGIKRLLGGNAIDTCHGDFNQFKQKLDAAIDQLINES